MPTALIAGRQTPPGSAGMDTICLRTISAEMTGTAKTVLNQSAQIALTRPLAVLIDG
jgi:hypothetical protein